MLLLLINAKLLLAYSQGEILWLSLDGSLEGKYVYQKLVYLDLQYLSICSSILGYDYVTTKSATLVISDRLDLNVLIVCGTVGKVHQLEPRVGDKCHGHYDDQGDPIPA